MGYQDEPKGSVPCIICDFHFLSGQDLSNFSSLLDRVCFLNKKKWKNSGFEHKGIETSNETISRLFFEP